MVYPVRNLLLRWYWLSIKHLMEKGFHSFTVGIDDDFDP
jgi:hypothetical protein